MSITLPEYGLVVPTETTPFNKLGKEFREMGISIEAILKSFDYNGADPNQVLSNVAALEMWQAAAQYQIATLEARPAPKVQRGQYNYASGLALNAVSSELTVTFATEFATIPFISFTLNAVRLNIALQNVTTTGFSFYLANYSTTSQASALVRWEASE